MEHVSFTIRPGESIGLVGKTGSGKTTLVDLILRTYNVNDGQLFLDGRDVNDLSIRSVRDACAYVPQDNFLFSDTIENNIAFGKSETVSEEIRRAAEIASRQCLSGPHKDDLLVEIDEKAAKSYASQGQTRTAALSLKLAAREIFQQDTGEYPVLLLDDVLSELDPRRQEFVLNRIRGGQVFITCCEDDRLPQLLGGRIFHVKNGTVR